MAHTFPDPAALAGTLYRGDLEHESCGIGFVARIDGTPSHEIVELALTALCRQLHRGGLAADGDTGDGAGVLLQVPRAFLARELASAGAPIDEQTLSDAAVGMCFLPGRDADERAASRAIIDERCAVEGLTVCAWRSVPVAADVLSPHARASMPSVEQVIIARPAELDADAFERLLLLVRRAIERAAREAGVRVHVASLSARTIVYKGMLASTQVGAFYPELHDKLVTTAVAMYHQRFSTNTFPSWERAQPLRMLCHNGEINTIRGNVDSIRGRHADLDAAVWAGRGADLVPVVDERGSDSSMLDNVVEMLVRSGMDARRALMMCVPKAWEQAAHMQPDVREFYEYQSLVMESWDGPAALSFCDGRRVGTVLDRNGLRPARYVVTTDGLVISGSEVGLVDLPPERVAYKGRLGPGDMIAVDLVSGRVELPSETTSEIITASPWAGYTALTVRDLEAFDIAPPVESARPDGVELLRRMAAAGYSREDISVVLKPMAVGGTEPIGSMGDDTPLAALSQFPRSIYGCFRQRFAEVTNPPIDPIRERGVMSLTTLLGSRPAMLVAGPPTTRLLRLPTPVLGSLDGIVAAAAASDMPIDTLDATVPAVDAAGEALRTAITQICDEAQAAVAAGAQIIIIDDRGASAQRIAVPSIMATGAVHHRLTDLGVRSRVSLVSVAADVRDAHQLACLVSAGANTVFPWLAIDAVHDLAAAQIARPRPGTEPVTIAAMHTNFLRALEQGLLKVISKMGIATIESYCGAQVFETVGLDADLVATCCPGAPSSLAGLGFAHVAAELASCHERAYGATSVDATGEAAALAAPAAPAAPLDGRGFYKFKRGGELHAFEPAVVRALHDAVGVEDVLASGFPEGYRRYGAFAELVDAHGETDIRDLLDLTAIGPPVPLDEVEPASEILHRFSTGAMSHGSLATESHVDLALAMNLIGASSNSGEGGEDPDRFGTNRGSAIKQVASGRFGVTPGYLVSARELQIKMAQGSKPGEGGHLPGAKVSEEIARIRHTTPGVELISPPPHHDIYSIEDLAQLIFDLREVNEHAAISVKLVAQAGVGTIAAGVVKTGADVVHISGHVGGTGASPLTSIKQAGGPWELGLAETQQTLVGNGLRGRVRLRVDGGLRTGRDVMVAAMLGADEFAFGTVALVAQGCTMARTCHNNQCPVGIATQRRDLRDKYPGTPEMVAAYFRFVAEHVRELLASLGARHLREVVGQSDHLVPRPGVIFDTSRMLARPAVDATQPLRFDRHEHVVRAQRTLSEQITRDTEHMVEAPPPAAGGPARLRYVITNEDRAVGTRLSSDVVRTHGSAGLPDPTFDLRFEGSAGQSFGAFLAPGIELTLIGEANDYVGKGMAGGVIVMRPPVGSIRESSHHNQILGNTALYGATGGLLLAGGRAGERLGVRNSGATVVVEGVGDHCCEYMTGGTVVVLGEIGRNFGAGMTGGRAWVYSQGSPLERCNAGYVDVRRARTDEGAELHELLERHRIGTRSPRALRVLDGWHQWRERFWLVEPHSVTAAT